MSATRAEGRVAVERPVSLATTLWHRAREHDLTGLSAEMAYRFLFALFPFALFLAAVAAAVSGGLCLAGPTGRNIDRRRADLPPELAAPVRPERRQGLGPGRTR